MKHILWLLFITLGLSACGGGSKGSNPTAISSSSSSSPSPHFLVKFEGDNQLSQPNSILPIEPKVRVTDPSDQPIAGITVNFAITTGDGTIQNASAVTDSSGFAYGGSWNPGSNIGLNTLTATVEGLAPVIFATRTRRSSPYISVNTSGYRVLSHQNLTTSIDSTYLIQTVSATINGIAIDIEYIEFPNQAPVWWTFFSELEAIPSGPIVYVVTVTDALGNTADSVMSTILDRPPTASISNIEEGFVLQSLSLEVSATCTDDLGICRSILVDVREADYDISRHSLDFIDKYISSIHEFIDIPMLSGKRSRIAVSGTDTYGSFGPKTYRNFYVEPSPLLSFYAKASDKILDISNNHVLFIDFPSQTSIPTLKLLNVLAGTEQIITEDQGLNSLEFGHARITAEGVVYAFDPAENTSSEKFIYEWRDNNVTMLSKMESMKFSENANWLIYFDGDSFWKRNLSDGTSVLVVDAPETTNGSSISSQGDIVWEIDSNIYSLRPSAHIPELISSGTLPLTDGINIVYRKNEDGDWSQARCPIAAHNGIEETILSTKINSFAACQRFDNYVIGAGYIAYTKDRQIWLYHNGNTQQLTFFTNPTNDSFYPEAIAPDGTISLIFNKKRYIQKPGQELKEIGSSLGKPFFRDGRLFIVIGYTILEAAL